MAGKPADEDHPFGHGRVEYIAAFIVAFIVIQVGFSLFKTSLGKILHPEEMTFKYISIVILLMSICVKLWMGMFNRKLGKRIHSSVMMATAADSMGDVGTTSATILSILVYGIWGLNIDGIVGLIVSLIVMWAGVGIARDTLAPLIGEPIDPKLYREITEFVESFDGIVGSHDLIVHNYGPSRSMASIHAEVPNDVSIEKSHEIIDYVEREAQRRFGIFLVIHMDPIETKDCRVTEFKKMVEAIVKSIDSKCSNVTPEGIVLHTYKNGKSDLPAVCLGLFPESHAVVVGNTDAIQPPGLCGFHDLSQRHAAVTGTGGFMDMHIKEHAAIACLWGGEYGRRMQ